MRFLASMFVSFVGIAAIAGGIWAPVRVLIDWWGEQS